MYILDRCDTSYKVMHNNGNTKYADKRDPGLGDMYCIKKLGIAELEIAHSHPITPGRRRYSWRQVRTHRT